KIADKLKLVNPKILSPKTELLQKLVVFVPQNHSNKVKQALYDAGAGNIGNYSNCSFSVSGTGTFKPNDKANPFIGSAEVEENVNEDRIEVVFPSHIQHKIISALNQSHPYEEVAHYITTLQNYNQEVGSGIVAELEKPMNNEAFLKYLKDKMNLNVIRHTTTSNNTVKTIAICGGAGSFLLSNAKRAKADVFITADFKYHEFFDAENELMICDIGHYESEVFTKDLIYDILIKKFTTFALCLSEVNTNPISYF
ncbi:MAG: Nif3-like dinuclear metal center hexameric protein, partial [Cyclobacteriaceae bacterium]|nr:Nif3-like dinuclear metal center hexameric protein [Cyclobacteriaceae bacterium]